VSIHAIGIAKCVKCQSNCVVVGKTTEGTHGNAVIKWTLPKDWGTTPAGSPLDYLCGDCMNPGWQHNGVVPRKPMNVNVLANIVSVLRADAQPEDMVEALRALLAVES
jgi:hypothetical protein